MCPRLTASFVAVSGPRGCRRGGRRRSGPPGERSSGRQDSALRPGSRSDPEHTPRSTSPLGGLTWIHKKLLSSSPVNLSFVEPFRDPTPHPCSRNTVRPGSCRGKRSLRTIPVVEDRVRTRGSSDLRRRPTCRRDVRDTSQILGSGPDRDFLQASKRGPSLDVVQQALPPAQDTLSPRTPSRSAATRTPPDVG